VPEPVCKAKGKIRAAKHWLTRAEKHFDLNAPMRGQMDLLLAEAELRSTRETVDSHSHSIKLNWGLQIVALSLAAVLVVAGISSAWWWYDVQAIDAPVLQPVTPPAPIAAAPVQHNSTVLVRSAETPAATAVDATISTQEVKRTDKSAAPESALSPEEMKRLIHTAGQTLRGRTKP
jgi:cytoskeletal protein RodZ